MHTYHRRFLASWGRRTGYVIATLEAASFLWAAAARADYHVEVCSDLSTGAPSNSSGWTASQRGQFVGASGCDGGGYMDAALYAGVSHNYTDNGTLLFNAPANTSITSFSLWRWDEAAPAQPYGAPVNTISYDGQAIDACSQGLGCSGEGSTTSSSASVVGASGLNAHQIAVIAACGGGSGGVCPASSEDDEIRIYGGDIQLTQATSPSAGPVFGSLVAGGVHTGTQTVSYSASDNGSGVYSASLIIDGRTVASAIPNTNGGRCQPTRQNADGSLVFNYVVPCPSSASGTFSFNTADLADGAHDVQIAISDAAGNTTPAFDGTIVTQNAAPPGSALRWSVSLRVWPRRVRLHTRITLAGRVSTSPQPPDGKLVYLQARSVALAWKGRGRARHRVIEGGRWIIFQALQAQADGAFRSTYRFRLGGVHRYQFQAVAPQEGGYANPTGASAAVTVTENVRTRGAGLAL